MAWSSFLVNLPLALSTVVLWLLVAFAVSRIVHRHAVIDVFWGSGFLVVYAESLLFAHAASGSSTPPWFSVGSAGDVRIWLLVLVALWSLRLSGYLAIRQRGAGEDPRYTRILRGARGKNETLYALKMIYGFQMVLLFFISIPLQFMAFATTSLIGLAGVGFSVIVIGIAFESLADFQLRRFLANPANRGTTLTTGLWATTRHPNYFGDAVVWWGIFIVVASTRWGLLSIASPVAMTYLLTSVSGKPMLEAKLTKTREGYAQYVATTSGFIPRRPKRSS
jgi:steroid 5-alpha reductase family enzyme